MKEVLIDLTSAKTEDCNSTINYVESLLEQDSDSIGNIVVLAHGRGVKAIAEESDVSVQMESMINKGVIFKASQGCLDAQGIQERDIIEGVEMVAHGYEELDRLQSEGYNVTEIP